MCRFTKCKSAGMVNEWVLSAYTPRVEQQRSSKKTKASSKGMTDFPSTTATNYNGKNDAPFDEIISNMKQTHEKALIIDMKVIK